MSEQVPDRRESLDFGEVGVGDLISVASGNGRDVVWFDLLVTEITDGCPMGPFTTRRFEGEGMGNIPMALRGCVSINGEVIDGIQLGTYLYMQPGGRGGYLTVKDPGREISEIILRKR